jgi:hypothetical protein
MGLPPWKNLFLARTCATPLCLQLILFWQMGICLLAIICYGIQLMVGQLLQVGTVPFLSKANKHCDKP